MDDRDARRGSIVPKTDPIDQKPPLMLPSDRIKSLECLDIARFAVESNLTIWAAIDSANIHPHGWPPTKKLRRPTVALKPFSAKLVSANKEQSALEWDLERHPICHQSETYQSHRPPSLLPSAVAGGELANHHPTTTSAKPEQADDGEAHAARFALHLATGVAVDARQERNERN